MAGQEPRLLHELGIGSAPKRTPWREVVGPKRAFGNVKTGHRVGNEEHATPERSSGVARVGGTFADMRSIVSTLTSGTAEERKRMLSHTIMVLNERPDAYSISSLQEMAGYVVRIVQNNEEKQAVRINGMSVLLQIVRILEESPSPCDAGTARVLLELRKVAEEKVRELPEAGSVVTKVHDE